MASFANNYFSCCQTYFFGFFSVLPEDFLPPAGGEVFSVLFFAFGLLLGVVVVLDLPPLDLSAPLAVVEVLIADDFKGAREDSKIGGFSAKISVNFSLFSPYELRIPSCPCKSRIKILLHIYTTQLDIYL